MKSALFTGIDLTSSPSKPTACVALDGQLRLHWFGILGSDAEIVEAVERDRPRLVAIDAPLSLPKGLCCLEGSCSCRPLVMANGRVCERELSRRGISCYYTTKKSIIKPMVYRAMRLKDELEARGCHAIEVYPYAAKVQLFGRHIPRKGSSKGVAFLRGAIGEFMPQTRQHLPGFGHDLCDALLAAYTAYLCGMGCAESIGDAGEGVIVVPAARPHHRFTTAEGLQ